MSRINLATRRIIKLNALNHRLAPEMERLKAERGALASACFDLFTPAYMIALLNSFSHSERSDWLNLYRHVTIEHPDVRSMHRDLFWASREVSRKADTDWRGVPNPVGFHLRQLANVGFELPADRMQGRPMPDSVRFNGFSFDESSYHAPILARVLQLVKDVRRLFNEAQTLATDMDAVLSQCNTVKQLLAVWPDSKPFIPADALAPAVRKTGTALVDAELVNRVNALLAKPLPPPARKNA